MDQTDRNALDYESCRRGMAAGVAGAGPVSGGEGGDGLPAAPAPDMKGRRNDRGGAGGPAAIWRPPAGANRRPADDAADGRTGGSTRPAAAGGVLPGLRQCYRPALASGPGETLPWRQLLRQRYHQEVCAARQYDQAARSVGDPCLAGLFRELSREEDCHARQLLGLLEQNILAF